MLTLLAVACTAGLGASKAAAAASKITIHKISACGYVATKAGTYALTQSVTDSGSGPCITLNGDNITLYLDSHTITGTGTDTCVLVEGGNPGLNVNETVFGGTMPKPTAKGKPKPPKPATLTNCDDGLVVVRTSGTTASYLNIVAPSDAGVVGLVAGGMNVSHINLPMHAANSAPGFVLNDGADNVVAKSTVDYDGTQYAFSVNQETGDTFTSDTVKDTYNTGGSTGIGFYDHESSRDTFTHCISAGQFSGFLIDSEGYGPVTATYNTAKGSSANPTGVGFGVIGAFQLADFDSPFHTLISHNKANGFNSGFEDETAPEYAVAEKWIDNTADNYAQFGFDIGAATDYTMTGNIADANTAGKKYAGGPTAGFYLVASSSDHPFASFAKNQAYDSEYGFYSVDATVGGKGNIAKRNKYKTYNVEITG